MYNHNKAQQSKNRVHIYWDILYNNIIIIIIIMIITINIINGIITIYIIINLHL